MQIDRGVAVDEDRRIDCDDGVDIVRVVDAAAHRVAAKIGRWVRTSMTKGWGV